jgi:hypothetical protein
MQRRSRIPKQSNVIKCKEKPNAQAADTNGRRNQK